MVLRRSARGPTTNLEVGASASPTLAAVSETNEPRPDARIAGIGVRDLVLASGLRHRLDRHVHSATPTRVSAVPPRRDVGSAPLGIHSTSLDA
ncbi:hypothetical protein LAUMK35_05689 [Mycobacterium pseudokansasii]|nr:hypothetical protein LAUMK35_05689 [Mycobacterium pseudokansasii]VBA35716.1 hypothetical protein LAUMK21_05669 [Mycobacterium pseudokansasii]